MNTHLHFRLDDDPDSESYGGFVAFRPDTDKDVWLCISGVRETFDLPASIDEFVLNLNSEHTLEAIKVRVGSATSQIILITDDPMTPSEERVVPVSNSVNDFFTSFGIKECFVTLEYRAKAPE